MPSCRIEGCDNPIHVKGRELCRSHYDELRRRREIGKRPTCSVDDCDTVAVSRGLCDKHYRRFLRKGDADRSVRWRFGQKYRIDEATGCWNWTDSLRTGYGFLLVEGVKQMAHRVSYELHVGPIPEGLQVDHLCRNRACVNPDHLEAVTQRENILRSNNLAAKWARRTECHVCGGPFDISSSGRRICRSCSRRRQREYNERKRAS